MSGEPDRFGNLVVPQQPPRDYARIVQGVIQLRRAFASCGLEPPTAILVKPREAAAIASIMAMAPEVLHVDTIARAAGDVSVCGVQIRPDVERQR